MPTDVTAFTALARTEFMQGKIEAESRPMPAKYDQFVTQMPSTVRVETHTYMSALPRLAKFTGYKPGTRFGNKEYTVANEEFRIGPVSVKSTDLDDDQTGGLQLQIGNLFAQGQKDIGYQTLAHLARGSTTPCFDATNFFAAAHTVGSGNNTMTFTGVANVDAAAHRIIALRTDNSIIKPIVFQDRQSLSELMTDADTPQAKKQKEFEYWADCRFGLAYGYWWDGINNVITNTPSVAECYQIVEQIINRFRTFILPKGNDTDENQYVHEGWDPEPSSFVLLCNLQLGTILKRAISLPQYTTPGGNVDNVYKDVAKVIPTSAL